MMLVIVEASTRPGELHANVATGREVDSVKSVVQSMTACFAPLPFFSVQVGFASAGP